MKENYDRAFEFIMKHEGYKSDDPDDKGGRTIFGISERSHPAVVSHLWDLPKKQAREEAKIFYKHQYWNKAHCDHIEDGMDIFVFDTFVNMGINYTTTDVYLFDLFVDRIERYAKIAKKGNNIKFLRGWLNRMIDLYKFIREE